MRSRQAIRWTVAMAITAATLGGSSLAVAVHVGVGAAIPVFMLLALLACWQAGLRAAIAVSLASTLCLDFFFTEPRLHFRIDTVQDVFALLCFLIVSILMSYLAERVRVGRARLQATEQEQRCLYDLAQSLLLTDWQAAPEEHICHVVLMQLHLEGVAVWEHRGQRFSSAGDASDVEHNLLAATLAERDFDLPLRTETIRVLRFGTRVTGAILFRGAVSPLLAGAVATLIAGSLERMRALRAAALAETVTLSEQLRTAVLDGLAHTVKTPLTTIAVASSALRELGGLSSLQHELATTIEQQALHISTVTNRLLRTAKMETREVALHRKHIDLQSVLDAAIRELPADCSIDRIDLALPATAILLESDPDLLRMAFVQLLENALKYSPAESRVQVHLAHAEHEASISVHNDGSYIPPEERQLIFERFYRSPSTGQQAPGTGLGLSIARRAVEMHQGSLRVESERLLGTTFHMAIPAVVQA